MKKAAIYSRFSTDRQNETSIEDQERVCGEFAEREGMTVIARHTDEGISGAALGNRPGARALMEAAFALRFEVVLVTDLSRLSRSNGDLSKMIDRLVARGIRVIGVQDGYDSDRRGHKLQAGLAGIMGEAFRDMIKDRTHSALESRARAHRSAGGKCYGFRTEPADTSDLSGPRVHAVDESQAIVVRQIFERYAEGASCRTIARELNAQGIPLPGSHWKRKNRRNGGWMGSGIRAIVLNERYTGQVSWNCSKWTKDPDSGKRIRRERPKSDWHVYHDEELRIVSDELFRSAELRSVDSADDNHRLKCGGKPRYLLSGLLKCDKCGSSYTLGSAASYACGGYLGGSCDNDARVRREQVEEVILDPIRKELLAPARVAKMAEEMKQLFAARLQEQAQRASALPAELAAIHERIGRLRDRLVDGDPDLEPDEIQGAIDRAEEKRRELMEMQPAAKQSAKLTAMLPKAAAEYRRQIEMGLDDDPRAAGKARALLRKLLGTIRLCPGPDKSLWAEYQIYPAALLRGAGAAGVGTGGSGGRI